MITTKTQKVLLGIFTLLPFIIFPIIFLQIFQFVVHVVAESNHGDPEPADILAAVFSFVTPIILLGILSLGLLVFYIVHVASNKEIQPVERIMWVLLFIFIGVIAFPIYWLLRIWISPTTTT
jgi:hypothetical protein